MYSHTPIPPTETQRSLARPTCEQSVEKPAPIKLPSPGSPEHRRLLGLLPALAKPAASPGPACVRRLCDLEYHTALATFDLANQLNLSADRVLSAALRLGLETLAAFAAWPGFPPGNGSGDTAASGTLDIVMADGRRVRIAGSDLPTVAELLDLNLC